ncbi:MAG: Rieske (2Fe-2S) protein [Gammaproteobacteria bacterium]|nr:Rieske (2Fe-2S) protein [Gammaproteobacteria bacterium]
MEDTVAGYLDVAALDDIKPGRAAGFSVDGHEVLVCREGDGEKVHAFHNRCTHAGAPMNGARCTPAGWFACPLHGARFDLATGASIGTPPYLPLTRYPSRIVDGRVQVAPSTGDTPA